MNFKSFDVKETRHLKVYSKVDGQTKIQDCQAYNKLHTEIAFFQGTRTLLDLVKCLKIMMAILKGKFDFTPQENFLGIFLFLRFAGQKYQWDLHVEE